MTREEVIKGLQCCTDPSAGGCKACPFEAFGCTCQLNLMCAALNRIEDLETELKSSIRIMAVDCNENL